MATELTTIPLNVQEEPEETLSMHPRKFLLWLFIVSITMMFAAFTSAYLVRKAEGNWLEFDLPPIFWYSTGVLLVSSLTMTMAVWAAKKDKFGLLRTLISITFALGLAFLVMQVLGWGKLVDMNVFFVGNPSGSFVYVFSLVHGIHIIAALVVLVFALVAAYRMRIHAKNLVGIQMAATFWHYLDVLWLYLFIFLLYNN